MVIQAGNIVAGFILAAPKIKTWFKSPQAGEQVVKAETKLNNFRGTMGVIEIVLGVIVVLQSFGIGFNYFLGYELLQGIAAIIMGLLLSANFFEKFPAVHGFIAKIQPFSEWIGVVGIALGILGLV